MLNYLDVLTSFYKPCCVRVILSNVLAFSTIQGVFVVWRYFLQLHFWSPIKFPHF